MNVKLRDCSILPSGFGHITGYEWGGDNKIKVSCPQIWCYWIQDSKDASIWQLVLEDHIEFHQPQPGEKILL